MSTTFATVDALFSTVVGESDSAARLAILRANRALLTNGVLSGIAKQATQLAAGGETERALTAFTIGGEAARTLVEAGALDALALVVNFAGGGANVAIEAGDSARARTLLSDARRVARSVNSRNAELWILRNLISATIGGAGERDWKSATGYALEAGRLLSAPPSAPRPGEPPPPDPSAYADVLRVLATTAYESEDFETSASLARVWRLAAPADSDATHELALSMMRLGRYAEAEALWRELVAAAPDDASLHANLAGSISPQGRFAEAAAVLDRAIELSPDDIQFRRFRVRVKRAGGDVAGAIADLSELIARCDAPSLREVLDVALLERAQVYEAAADPTHALEDLARVARESDPATAAHALRERSRILSARGERDQAIAAVREAVQRAPQDAKSVMALGEMLAEAQADTEAIQVLARLVLQEELARDVVRVMTPVVDRAAANVQARLVRGFAAETAHHPAVANEDFSVVLEQDPSNAHLFYRRGRVRLMNGDTPDDEAWNRSLTRQRVLDAAADFARAVALDAADEDARHSLVWVVDRICTMRSFQGVFHDPTDDASRAILHVLPTLERTLQRFLPALDLASSGAYGQALEQWRLLQSELLELSMPVSACHMDMYIADSLLRLHDVQGALAALDRADKLLFHIGQPMLRTLAEEAVETRRRTMQESGRPALVIEKELANVYALFLEDMPRRVDMLRIDALGRVGDFEQMLRLLDENAGLEQNVDPEFLNAHFNIAARLRDAAQPERALALANRIDRVASDPRDRSKLLNLRGSIRMNLGQLDDAEADFREALAGETKYAPAFAPFISLNLARVLVAKGRFADAHDTLEAANGKLDGATPFEQMTYHWLLADTAIGLDDVDTAKAEMAITLDLAEQLRGTLQDPANRIAWQGRLTQLYDLAVYIALRAEDPALIFELVERTRARAYLDVIRTGAAEPPDSAKELVDALESLRGRRDILVQLDETLRLYGANFVDLELVRALARDAPDLTVVKRTSSGQQIISPSVLREALIEINEAIARVEAQIDEARATASAATVGTTLTAEALAALLQPGVEAAHAPRQRGAPAAIVLVELFEVRGVVCCLALRSGETTPSLHPVDVSPNDIAELASRASWGDADADADDAWQHALSAIVTPAAERSNPGDLLWIVPYGPLHQVPLHAALVGDVPLLERNPVCYSPSASVLPACLERSRGTYASAVVVGDVAGDLPFASAECASVAARFGTTAIVGSAATEQAFSDALEKAGERLDVLHLATHGTFDADDALDSGFELAAGRETVRLTARDIVRGELPVELVTLSACESGRTQVFAGDEPVGLTRAFLTAGASAVLATLWLIDDLSTRLIVDRFYEVLQRPSVGTGTGWRKAEALREASLAVREVTLGALLRHDAPDVAAYARELAAAGSLREGDRPFAAARYWAPFALVGAWT